MASLALATTFVSKSIFNDEENDNSNDSDVSNDDYAPTYCFMAGSAQATTACPVFDGSDYPKWKVLNRKHLISKNSEL